MKKSFNFLVLSFELLIKNSQKGVTLVLVLAILTILTLLGVSFTFVMRTEMQSAGNYAYKLKADYLAELGLTAVRNRLTSERIDAKGRLTAYSGFTSKSLGLASDNGTTNPDVKVQDEESKLNLLVALDTANKDEWHRLSADNFLYARLSTANISYSQATGVVSLIHTAFGKGQLKSLDNLKNVVGIKIYNVLSSYVTFYSFESNIDQNSKQRIDINKSIAKDIYERLKDVIGKEQAARLAVNIVDFRDSDNIPTLLTVDGVTYRGVEMTPYINEVMPWSKTPEENGNDGQYVELFNPYHDDIKIDGWRLEGNFGTIDLYGTVPSKGYFIITDEYADDPDFDGGEADGYSFQNNYGNVSNDNLVEEPGLSLAKGGDTLKLYDGDGNLIDVLTYGDSAKDVSWEKNDPRVNALTQKEHGSPYALNNAYVPTNGSKDEDNLAYIADVSYKSIGDLCFVTIASPETPWLTLSNDSNNSQVTLDKVIDYLTVSEDKENLGAININTAPYEVLMALPGVNKDLVQSIIEYRKDKGFFTNISDLLKVPGMDTPVASTKTKKSTSYSTEMEEKTLNFRKLSNMVSVRSYNFTVDSYAKLVQNKKFLAESRIRALVNRSNSPVVTVMEKRSFP